MLVQILLALLLGWYLYMLARVLRLFAVCRRGGGYSPVRLTVMVGNQENYVEGFLYRLVLRCSRLWPHLEVTVVVDRGDDATLAIARILGRETGLAVAASGEVASGLKAAVQAMYRRLPGEPRDGLVGGSHPVWYYDARGLQGFGLLRAPVFSRLGWI